MGEYHEVSIDTSNDTPQPTLEELAAKMDEQAPPTQEDRPTWLPEKFKSPEEMAKAYGELEKKFSSRSVKQDEETVEEEANIPEREEEAPTDPTPQEQAEEAVTKAGLDLDDLSAKYFEQGSLDEADYSALEKAGYPKHLVDAFIAGQEAVAAQTETKVFESVGGQQTYSAMLDWASEELSPGEVKAYNKAVNSGDIDEVMAAVKGLHARYQSSVGFEPTRQIKADGKSAAQSVYRSVAEMQRDMSDPRYKTDPAFRKDVEQKLGRSNIF